MRLPLQITFRHMDSSDIIERWIREEAAKLETFYKQIMRCHVTVEMPHSHHRKGSQYHIRIDLTVPGRELVIKQIPSLSKRPWQEGRGEIRKQMELESRHKKLRQAINDAFKSAGRRLQDFARRQHGDVKHHEPTPQARVVRLFPDESCGFLATEDGREVYFHKDSVLGAGFKRLRVGTLAAFVEEQGEKGPQASTVRILGKQGSRREARKALAATG